MIISAQVNYIYKGHIRNWLRLMVCGAMCAIKMFWIYIHLNAFLFNNFDTVLSPFIAFNHDRSIGIKLRENFDKLLVCHGFCDIIRWFLFRRNRSLVHLGDVVLPLRLRVPVFQTVQGKIHTFFHHHCS